MQWPITMVGHNGWSQWLLQWMIQWLMRWLLEGALAVTCFGLKHATTIPAAYSTAQYQVSLTLLVKQLACVSMVNFTLLFQAATGIDVQYPNLLKYQWAHSVGYCPGCAQKRATPTAARLKNQIAKRLKEASNRSIPQPFERPLGTFSRLLSKVHSKTCNTYRSTAQKSNSKVPRRGLKSVNTPTY